MKTCRTHGPGSKLCRFCFRVVVTVLLVFCFRTVTYYTSRFPICQILWPNFVYCAQSSFRNFVKSVCFCAEKPSSAVKLDFCTLCTFSRTNGGCSRLTALPLRGFPRAFPLQRREPHPQVRLFRLSRNYSFADNLCLRRGGSPRPTRKNTDVRKFHAAAGVRGTPPYAEKVKRYKTVMRAPGFYDFALQNLFHAHSRAKHCIIEKSIISANDESHTLRCGSPLSFFLQKGDCFLLLQAIDVFQNNISRILYAQTARVDAQVIMVALAPIPCRYSSYSRSNAAYLIHLIERRLREVLPSIS